LRLPRFTLFVPPPNDSAAMSGRRSALKLAGNGPCWEAATVEGKRGAPSGRLEAPFPVDRTIHYFWRLLDGDGYATILLWDAVRLLASDGLRA